MPLMCVVLLSTQEVEMSSGAVCRTRPHVSQVKSTTSQPGTYLIVILATGSGLEGLWSCNSPCPAVLVKHHLHLEEEWPTGSYLCLARHRKKVQRFVSEGCWRGSGTFLEVVCPIPARTLEFAFLCLLWFYLSGWNSSDYYMQKIWLQFFPPWRESWALLGRYCAFFWRKT